LPLLADSTRCMPIANSSMLSWPSLSTSLRSLGEREHSYETIKAHDSLLAKWNYLALDRAK
jgi:hypothetical protein